jgi:hypothetical protein
LVVQVAVKIGSYCEGWFHSQSDFGPPVAAKGTIGENKRSIKKVATQRVRSANERYLSRLVVIDMAAPGGAYDRKSRMRRPLWL